DPMPDWMTYAVDAAILVPVMVFFVRLAGLRAFSKMSSYDFAVTVAFGSVLAATVVNPGVTLWQGIAGMAALFAVQWLIGLARSRSDAVEYVADNSPVILMRDGKVIMENLTATRVTMSDLRAKLREANVLSFDEVRAVVLETTGDVSVLHGDHLDDALLNDVIR
ncbi:MAG: YetF domain-containing protein, partial [Jannaschia helgolandensis]